MSYKVIEKPDPYKIYPPGSIVYEKGDGQLFLIIKKVYISMERIHYLLYNLKYNELLKDRLVSTDILFKIKKDEYQ